MYKPKMIENEQDICCSKGHKLPVVTIALDQKLSRDQRLLCTECLENTDIDGITVGLKKIISQIEENQVKKMEKVQNIIMDQINLIESLHSIVYQMKSHVIQQLDQLTMIMMGWIQNLDQQRSQYTQYSFFEELEIMFLKQNKTEPNLQELIHEIQQTNLCWTTKLHPTLEYFNQFLEYNKCKELLTSLEFDSQNFSLSKQQLYVNIQRKKQEIQPASTLINIPSLQTNQSNLKPFNYQLIQECSISQTENCFAIAIDKDCSTLVVGCKQLIKVFEFNQGIIKHIQTLNEHKNWVQSLNFMDKSKQFISGSMDKSLMIWKYNQNSQWGLQYILNGHNDYIQCLVINKNEDLIISGSEDCTIKFWINKNEWLCQQTITDHSKPVYGLSLNQQQNRIVSCGNDNYLLIIEQSGQNTEWKVIQRITVEWNGY